MCIETTVSPNQKGEQAALTERIPWGVILSIIILVGFALQTYRLDAQNLWYDEALSVAEATAPLPDTLDFLRVSSMSHLPLFYVLLHYWLALAGQSEFALRFFSVLFGTASLPLMFQLGRRLFSAEVGLFAAAILAMLPVQLYYAQEGRMYTMVAFLGLLSCYLLVRLLARDTDDPPPHRRPSLWMGYVAATILMLLSHYFAAFIAIFQNAFFALTQLRRRSLLWRWIVAQLCVSIVPGMWLTLSPGTVFTLAIATQRGPGSAISPLDFVRALWYDLNVGSVSVPGTIAPRPPLGYLAYGLAPLFLIGLIAAYGKWDPAPRGGVFSPLVRGLFVTGYLMIPVASIFVAPVGFQVRYLLITTPPYALLLAASLVWLRRKAPPLAAVGLLCLAAVYAYAMAFYYTSYSRSQYGLAMHELAARSRPDDGIVLNGPRQYMLFRYYYEGNLSFYPMPLMDLPDHFPVTGSPLRSEDAARDLAGLLAKHPRLWVVLAGEDELDPNFFVERWLNNHAFNLGCDVYSNCRVCLYERSLIEANTPVGIHFGDRLELAGFGLVNSVLPADAPLRLVLRWRALAQPSREYKITLRLVDTEGRLWGQADATPTSQYRTTANWFEGEEPLNYHVLRPDADTPPGDYQLLIGVYAADTGQMLTTSLGQGKLVTLSPIHIVP